MKTQNFKKWFENKGYKFEDGDFWMEEIITDHKFKDIIELINDYCSERETIKDQTNETDDKALHIADVVRGGFDIDKFNNDFKKAKELLNKSFENYLNSDEHKSMIDAFKKLGAIS